MIANDMQQVEFNLVLNKNSLNYVHMVLNLILEGTK